MQENSLAIYPLQIGMLAKYYVIREHKKSMHNRLTTQMAFVLNIYLVQEKQLLGLSCFSCTKFSLALFYLKKLQGYNKIKFIV